MEQVKLITVTVVLTLLIWTTAYQFVSETAEIDVTVRPQPTGEARMIVETDPPGQDRFRLTVTGPKRIVNQIQEQVRAQEFSALTIPIPERFRGQHVVDMREALSASRERLRGLHIDKVEPPEVRIFVDHLQTVKMPVHVEPGLLEYDVPPHTEPAEVEVTIGESALERLTQRRVPLEVEDLLRSKPEGEPLTIPGVPLTAKLAGGVVRIEPATVTLRATLRKQSKTGTIRAVPITVQASVEHFNRYRIETRDERTPITRAITVQGPPAAVDALVAGRVPVAGRIVLTGDLVALAGRFVELQPVFDLPPDVRLAAPVPPVELSLVPSE